MLKTKKMKMSLLLLGLAAMFVLANPAKASAGVAVVVGPAYAHPVRPAYFARPYVYAPTPVAVYAGPSVYESAYAPGWGYYPRNRYGYGWRPAYRGYYGRPYRFRRW